MASFLLIPLIIKQWAVPLMSKIAMTVRFMDIINKSWHLLQKFGCNLKLLFKKYQ